MSIFKCKMCGGTIEFEPGATVGVCDSCGTKQTLPHLDDDRRSNLYDRANHFRRNNEYDKAAGIYEQILNEDSSDAEAYWSLVLCHYGIEYVEDPKTHKHVPTVNRAQFTSIFDDDNYKSAIQYADGYQRELYEAEAKEINEIQKGILSISQKEEPFDVFICYKESDNSGRRTQDSVLANDLYHQLTQEGFKVFFSRITLEDKLGIAYEPYIFAALNSAKVMVVLGTRPEYFNAVWVKNEWSRYLALVKQSRGKKVLIPAYRDMDPYDLPEEFSHLQAQDMSKLGFMQDLIRGIKKIANTTNDATVVVKETINVEANVNSKPLLTRAFMFLEDGKWEEADAYCERVLDQDPQNAQAYLGKLMAELHVRRQEGLKDCPEPFGDNDNYEKTVRFGDEKLISTLKEYNAQITERNEAARLTEIYNSAVNSMNQAGGDADQKYRAYTSAAATFKSISGFKDADDLAEQCLQKAEAARKDSVYTSARAQMNEIRRIPVSDYYATINAYQKAIKTFESISGWKDSNEQIIACRRGIEEVKARQESDRLEREREEEKHRIAAVKAAKKRKKIKILVSIAAAVVLIAVVAVYVFVTVILPKQKYDVAMAHFNAGEYEEALAGFEKVENYKDSDELAEQCRTAIAIEEKYQKAAELYASGEYKAALEAFVALESYKDSAEQIEKCQAAIMEDEYNAAVELFNAGNYREAIIAFRELGTYKDSAEQITKCEAEIVEKKYNAAVELANKGSYDDAILAFQELGDYKDSTDQISQCEAGKVEKKYNTAVELLNTRNYSRALDAFRELNGYKDSESKMLEAKKLIFNNAKVGDYIYFGTYEQDNKTADSNEDIEWLVLAKEGNKVLVISRYILRNIHYHNELTDSITWEKCYLRKWLNETFIKKAFNADEQSTILNTTVTADKNPKYSTPPGKKTTDKIFLLSISEVERYFNSDKARQCGATAYAKAENASGSWWLRTPGATDNFFGYEVAYVIANGQISYGGTRPSGGGMGVRPAMWISLN